MRQADPTARLLTRAYRAATADARMGMREGARRAGSSICTGGAVAVVTGPAAVSARRGGDAHRLRLSLSFVGALLMDLADIALWQAGRYARQV